MGIILRMLKLFRPIRDLNRAVGTATQEEWLVLEQKTLPVGSEAVAWDRADAGVSLWTDAHGYVCAVTEGSVLWQEQYASAEDAVADYGVRSAEGESAVLDGVEQEVSGIETGLLTGAADKRACLALIRARRNAVALIKRCERALEAIERLQTRGLALGGVRMRYERLAERARSLRDYVTQVREAYQTNVGLRQNTLMRTFTVIAAIFMPLQLVTGWYGMNLMMPELHWRGSYPCVIAACAVLVGVLLVVFRKKHWL